MRTNFPTRRFGTAFDFDQNGMEVRAMVNRFDGNSARTYDGGGEIGEIFLNAGKPNSAANYMAQEAAILFSIARRYGAPVEVIASALPLLESGEPAGPMGQALKMAEST